MFLGQLEICSFPGVVLPEPILSTNVDHET